MGRWESAHSGFRGLAAERGRVFPYWLRLRGDERSATTIVVTQNLPSMPKADIIDAWLDGRRYRNKSPSPT